MVPPVRSIVEDVFNRHTFRVNLRKVFCVFLSEETHLCYGEDTSFNFVSESKEAVVYSAIYTCGFFRAIVLWQYIQ